MLEFLLHKQCIVHILYARFTSRVLKQALRSAGSNLTMKHVEEVSLSALFLLEAAKKTDEAFQTVVQTSVHTVHNFQKDLSSMAQHLLDKEVTTAKEDRNTPVFTDPIEQGWKNRSTTSWLQDKLSASFHEEEEEENLDEEQVDLDYELYYVHTCTTT